MANFRDLNQSKYTAVWRRGIKTIGEILALFRHAALYVVALLFVGSAASSTELSPAADGASVPALLSRYSEAMDAALYDEAADAAAQHITTLLEDPNHSRHDWADALVRLGDAQRFAEDHDSAIANYELAIETLHEVTDRLDESLIAPLEGASEALIATRQFNRAAKVLETVVHLRQVNSGPHNLEQCTALDKLSSVYLKLGDDRRALARAQARLGVYDQHYPGDDLRKLPALFSVAEYLEETGALLDSHTAYRRIVAMIERADGTRSPELLAAFYRISELLANNSIKDGYDGSFMARRYLQRAVHLAEKSDTLTIWQRADAHIAMGDFLAIHTLDRNGAMRRYRTAWQILAADEEMLPKLDAHFDEPTLLNEVPRHTSPIMKNLMSNLKYRETQPGARVLIRLDVAANGLPKDIEVIDGDPTGYWDPLVVDHVSKFVFRPSLEDGEPVAYRDLHFEVPFLAQDEDLLD